MSDNVIDYNGIAVLVASVATAIVSVGTFLRAGKVAKTIEVLEKNTNSIKDALVKTTGEKEYARGVKHEKERGKEEIQDAEVPGDR